MKTLTNNMSPAPKANGKKLTFGYRCVYCNVSAVFYVSFSADGKTAQKIGQIPSHLPRISDDLQNALGDNAELFKKGLICESQSYGIGAYAYYRRIVELTIDSLLEQIIPLIPPEKETEFKSAIAEYRDSHHTSSRIDLVKEMIPEALRPGGINPLGILFGHLSSGLHEKSDEWCLESAKNVRTALSSFVRLLSANNESMKELKKATHDLLKEKSKAATKK